MESSSESIAVLLFLMPVFSQAFLSFVGGYLVSFSFFSARHDRKCFEVKNKCENNKDLLVKGLQWVLCF